MKQLLIPFIISSLALFCACQTTREFSIDYLEPAEVSFPESLRRVAVVNNVPDAKGLIVQDEKGRHPYSTGEGDGRVAAESLAESLAQGDYFDEVVICDSVLRWGDSVRVSKPLSQQDVSRLTRKLDVDCLISIERIELLVSGRVRPLPEWSLYLGTIDAKVKTMVKVYLPQRQAAITTVISNDSIFWKETGISEKNVMASLVSEQEIIRQASHFAGTLPAGRLIPTWHSDQRLLFTGGSVEMRDAAVYARETKWNEAIQLWEKAYQQKRGKQKIQAAINLAVGHEMCDDVTAACEWIGKAQSLLGPDSELNHFVTLYAVMLEKRREQLVRLNTQMHRFDDEK